MSRGYIYPFFWRYAGEDKRIFSSPPCYLRKIKYFFSLLYLTVFNQPFFFADRTKNKWKNCFPPFGVASLIWKTLSPLFCLSQDAFIPSRPVLPLSPYDGEFFFSFFYRNARQEASVLSFVLPSEIRVLFPPSIVTTLLSILRDGEVLSFFPCASADLPRMESSPPLFFSRCTELEIRSFFSFFASMFVGLGTFFPSRFHVKGGDTLIFSTSRHD